MIQSIWNQAYAGVGWGIVWMPAAHFVLSGTVGLLAYWLTRTILWRGFSTTGSDCPCPADSSIHHYSLSLALASSVFVHILEDFAVGWF